MTTKANKARKQLAAAAAPDNTGLTRKAELAAVPELNAAGVMQAFNIHGEPDAVELMTELVRRGKSIETGDTKGIERMLMAQAHALDSMFASLARRAKNQDNLAPYNAHLKFALRAQSQCRATLETLATIKNPSHVAFVKQANIAHGPQQVNNGVSQDFPARAEESQNRPNELLGNNDGERLDSAASGAASAGDPIVATVEAIHRPAHGARKSRSEP